MTVARYSADAFIIAETVFQPLTRDQRDVRQLLLVQIAFHDAQAILRVFRRDGHARDHAGDAVLAGIFVQGQWKLLLLAFVRGNASRYFRR